MNSLEAKRAKAKYMADARALHDAAEKENRELTPEENDQFNSLVAQANKVEEKFARLQVLEGWESQSKESAGRISKPADIELPKGKERYSLHRAIQVKLSGRELDGVEGEISQEIALKTGKPPQGFYMPNTINTYALNTTTGEGAVGTKTDPAMFIDLLRSRMMANTLGATVLNGLVGNLSIPRLSGGATAYWVAESNSPSASNQTVDHVPLGPKTVAAYTDISRRFINQSSVDAEALTMNDLAAKVARAVDKAAFVGTGADNQPEGILYNSDIESYDTLGATPTISHLVALERLVAIEDADFGRLAYLTSPQGRSVYKVTAEDADVTTGLRLWRNNELNGYAAYASTQIPSNFSYGSFSTLTATIFGNWADLLIGFWNSAADVIVDPYTGSSSGTVRIVVLNDCDVAVRHPESFAYWSDVKSTL